MKKPTIIVTLLAFVLAAPLVYLLAGFDMLSVVSADHLVDVPPRWDYFCWLYWASWSVPAIWLVGLVLGCIELFRRRRGRVLAVCVAAPLALAVAFWLVLQGYLVLATHNA